MGRSDFSRPIVFKFTRKLYDFGKATEVAYNLQSTRARKGKCRLKQASGRAQEGTFAQSGTIYKKMPNSVVAIYIYTYV